MLTTIVFGVFTIIITLSGIFFIPSNINESILTEEDIQENLNTINSYARAKGYIEENPTFEGTLEFLDNEIEVNENSRTSQEIEKDEDDIDSFYVYDSDEVILDGGTEVEKPCGEVVDDGDDIIEYPKQGEYQLLEGGIEYEDLEYRYLQLNNEELLIEFDSVTDNVSVDWGF